MTMIQKLTTTKPMERKYLPTAEATKILGVCRNTLMAYMKEFKHGVHYVDRRRKGARKSSLFFNVQAIQEYWQIRPEKR